MVQIHLNDGFDTCTTFELVQVFRSPQLLAADMSNQLQVFRDFSITTGIYPALVE